MIERRYADTAERDHDVLGELLELPVTVFDPLTADEAPEVGQVLATAFDPAALTRDALALAHVGPDRIRFVTGRLRTAIVLNGSKHADPQLCRVRMYFMGEGPALDVTATAGLYCQVAGVLAGFAFTGLHQYLTRGGRPREGPVALSLFAALTALTICSLLYAILAGGRANSGPALTGLLIYGPVFGVAILSMFHALVRLLPTDDENLNLVVWSARIMVSIVGPAIVMALVSVGATYVVYVASCTTSCSTWLPLVLSKPAGQLGIIISAALFMGSIVAFWFSVDFGISGNRFWAVMPACLVLAVSMASVPFIFLLAALPPDFQPNDGHLALIDIFSFLLLGVFSVLTAATTAKAPRFSTIISSLRKRDTEPAPGGQEENKDHPQSDDNGAAGERHAQAGEIEPVAESSSPRAALQVR